MTGSEKKAAPAAPAAARPRPAFESEAFLVGALVLGEDAAAPIFAALEAADFNGEAAAIFAAAAAARARDGFLDLVTLAAELRGRGAAALAAAAAAAAQNAIANPEAIAGHIRLVRDAARRRQLWEDGRAAAAAALDGDISGVCVTIGAAAPPRVTLKEHLTDLGNAERLVRRHGARLRHCTAWGAWLVWDGGRWRRDEAAAAAAAAIETVRAMHDEAAAAAPELRRALGMHAYKSETAESVAAMLRLAAALPGVPVRPDELDRDPWLLTATNGTIDLRRGELRPHDPADLITRAAAAAYDPAAAAPAALERHLMMAQRGSVEMVAYLQRAVGYSATGVVDERCMQVLHGGGRNGKGVFLDAVAAVLGDYAARTPTETLLARRDGAIPCDVARLRGARFVYATEGEAGARLNEAMVKDLTGGETLVARHMRAEWFEFRPTFKLWFSTNHKPRIRGRDEAIWDRIRLVPFTVRVPDAAARPRSELLAELAVERDAILAWIVEGAAAWRRERLGAPPAVAAATAAYKTGEDDLAGFFEDRIDAAAAAAVKVAELYAAYAEWCGENGAEPLKKEWVGERLRDRGLETRRGGGGAREWVGIGLRPAAAATAADASEGKL